MSEETLFTAARRLVRNLNADFPSGLVSQETEAAAHALQVQIDRVEKAETAASKEEARRRLESRSAVIEGVSGKNL